jgi:hypothetical protein
MFTAVSDVRQVASTVGENKKGGKWMKSMQKIRIIKGVLILVAVLAIAGSAWAKKNKSGPGIPGVLNSARDSVTLQVPVDAIPTCDPLNLNQIYSVKVYIFQPSGRLLGIGIGANDGPLSCSATDAQMVDATVNAFPGLTFKPGPATLLYQVILTDNDPLLVTPTVTVVDENGSRVDLHK